MADSEFDVLLGGTERLPTSLNIAQFAAFRTQEIQVMKNCIVAQSGTKLAFQTLPKHMRRRAMSHNVKRLPRRLRQVHLNQQKKSGVPENSKRPSRKYRRRPRNLLEEYTRRSQKKYRWLPTHIWHAKRFHMVEKWGFKIPYRPCDKAFRACYRAISKHCLIQDVSYFNCIEISGDKETLVENLKSLCNQTEGFSFGAKAFLNGEREGEITVYDYNIPYPKPVGNINFHWRRVKPDKTCKLWMWVHPAIYKNIKDVLLKCLSLTSTSAGTNSVSYQDPLSNVTLLELDNKLSRFRLTGPLSTAILQDMFELVEHGRDPKQILLNQYIEEKSDVIQAQCSFWRKLNDITSPSEVPAHMILSLLVKDPRINFPKKRLKIVGNSNMTVSNVIMDLAHDLSESPLWEEEFRDEVAESKISDSNLASLQSSLLVPGSSLKNVGTSVPIILVQRPGSKVENIGFGSGWDVILPFSWAKSFWVSIIMRGARAGGLRESQSMLFEMGMSQMLNPDTNAGCLEEQQMSRHYEDKYFKKPPNKRTNYNKFNIVSPLSLNWKLLVDDWSNGSTTNEDLRVVRNKKILKLIDNMLLSKSRFLPAISSKCLIPVKLDCERKGSPAKFAIICLAQTANDFKHITLEPHSIDRFQKERKELRQKHQSMLKKLRRQRKNQTTQPIHSHVHQQVLIDYKQQNKALWLPEPTIIRKSCSREIIGFVQKGGFSYSRGKSFATGYIAANVLPRLLQSPFRNKVLFRNINTRQYRVAKLSVILE